MTDVFAPFKWEALFERWPDILQAFGLTVGISICALIIALVLGVLFGVLSVSRHKTLRAITRIYVEVVQNVPLLLQVFLFYAVFPLLGLSLASFWIGVLAIGFYHGAYMSEVVRSGIGSIHRGQFEAARSQGFGYWSTMLVIILPQAMRIIIPPMAVQAANLVKNTSVLALIAGGELMYFSNSFAGATSYYGPAYVVAAVLYFVLCFPLSRLAIYLENRMLTHRHVATGDASEQLKDDVTETTPGTHDITGQAAARALAYGVSSMYNGFVHAVPVREVPSPRHPLHRLQPVSAVSDTLDQNPFEVSPITGNVAARIADDVGIEIAQSEESPTLGHRRRAARKLASLRSKGKGHKAKMRPSFGYKVLPTKRPLWTMEQYEDASLSEEAFDDNRFIDDDLWSQKSKQSIGGKDDPDKETSAALTDGDSSASEASAEAQHPVIMLSEKAASPEAFASDSCDGSSESERCGRGEDTDQSIDSHQLDVTTQSQPQSRDENRGE